MNLHNYKMWGVPFWKRQNDLLFIENMALINKTCMVKEPSSTLRCQEISFFKYTLCSLAFLVPQILQSYWKGIHFTKEWTKCMLHETPVSSHFYVSNYIPYTWLYDTVLWCLFIKLNDWVEAESHRFFSPQIVWSYDWWMTEIHTVCL